MRSVIRSMNYCELKAAKELAADGWEVMKSGWPDFLCIRGEEIRFIEIKRASIRPGYNRRLSKRQARVAEVLSKLGVKVELWEVEPEPIRGLHDVRKRKDYPEELPNELPAPERIKEPWRY